MKRTRSRTSAKRATARPRKLARQATKAVNKPTVALTTIRVPRVGEIWPGEGGRFAGIGIGRDGAPDHLLIAHFAGVNGTHQRALDYPKTLKVDGHADFESPTLSDGALCYAGLRDHVEKGWYWLRDQVAVDPVSAWHQSFLPAAHIPGAHETASPNARHLARRGILGRL